MNQASHHRWSPSTRSQCGRWSCIVKRHCASRAVTAGLLWGTAMLVVSVVVVAVLVVSVVGPRLANAQEVQQLEARVAGPSQAGLAEAAERADWDAVAKLLDARADVNRAQADGTTALHWAARHERESVVGQLLKRGAAAGAVNRYGVSPLLLACENGDLKIARLLLAAGADPKATGPGDQSPLMTAARAGSADLVAELLKGGAAVDAADARGQTALMWSAAEGNIDAMQRLLAAGADCRRTLPSGMSPLMFAVREGRLEAAVLLIEAGVDVNAAMEPKSPGGRMARRGISALLVAVENGHFELAAKLLELKADPNDQRSGFTALHALTWVRKPNRGDGLDGDPPPIGSGRMTSLELVRQLVAAGADVNARLESGRSGKGVLGLKGATPLLMAADTADLPLIKLLADLGADPGIANADGATALMAAAGLGTLAPGEEAGTEDESLATVRWLLDHGAQINGADANGETSMHGAAYASFPRMVELLVQRGADPRVWHRPNKYGWTPLSIAEGHRPGNFKPDGATVAAIRRVLASAGIDPDERVPGTVSAGGPEYEPPAPE